MHLILAKTDMKRPRPPAPPVKLPLFDYEGWANRLVKSVRDGWTLAEAVASAEAYARDVRDIECVYEATRLMGRDAEQIHKNCGVPATIITHWQEEAVRKFGRSQDATDRKLARFLAAMYRDVRAAQVAEAVREAGAQAEEAEVNKDQQKAGKWRRVQANLEAMRQSISCGGFVPVPFTRE